MNIKWTLILATSLIQSVFAKTLTFEAIISNQSSSIFILTVFSDGVNGTGNVIGYLNPKQKKHIYLSYDRHPYPRALIRLQTSISSRDPYINFAILPTTYKIIGCNQPYNCMASYLNKKKIQFTVSS